jgi:hypothetical protein
VNKIAAAGTISELAQKSKRDFQAFMLLNLAITLDMGSQIW